MRLKAVFASRISRSSIFVRFISSSAMPFRERSRRFVSRPMSSESCREMLRISHLSSTKSTVTAASAAERIIIAAIKSVTPLAEGLESKSTSPLSGQGREEALSAACAVLL